jgi:hypothetical protein
MLQLLSLVTVLTHMSRNYFYTSTWFINTSHDFFLSLPFFVYRSTSKVPTPETTVWPKSSAYPGRKTNWMLMITSEPTVREEV